MLHGTRHATLPRYPGLCLVLSGGEDVAHAYGAEQAADYWIHEVELDLAGLEVEEVEVDLRAALDGEGFPGDSLADLADYSARGIDAITFTDADPRGVEHRTLRLFSERALSRLSLRGSWSF